MALRWPWRRRPVVLHPGLTVRHFGAQRLSDADVRAILYPPSRNVERA